MQCRRTHIPEVTENCNFSDRLHKQCRTTMNQQLRAPFAVLVQNTENVNSLTAQQLDNNVKEVAPDGNSTLLFIWWDWCSETWETHRMSFFFSKSNVYLGYPLTAQNNNYNGSFLKKDDPKIGALMQQAELLSSLALRVNTENSEQSLENAWKVSNNLVSILAWKYSCFHFLTLPLFLYVGIQSVVK